MKKIGILAVILALAFCLCACKNEVSLSDEQNALIAEYAADLLLKYDKNYQERLNESDTTTEMSTTEEESLQQTTTETLSQDISTENNDTVDTTETISDEQNDSSNGSDVTNVEDITVPPVDTGNEYDIAKIIGLDGMSITYDKCLFVDRYPALDSNGSFIYLEAKEGSKLIVTKFNVSNSTSDSIRTNLLDEEIDYRIVMNRSKAAKPMLTILMDDLGTYDSIVPANTEQSAVLVFQISNNLIDQIQSLDLRITYKDDENIIQLQ